MTYRDADNLLGVKLSMRYGEAVVLQRRGPAAIEVVWNTTTLIVFSIDDTMTLNAGRFRTPALRYALNQLLPPQWLLLQQNFDWWLVFTVSGELPIRHQFKDGIKLAIDTGMLLP